MPEDVLTQLGVNLPPLPEGTEGTVGNKTAPVTEAMEAPNMKNLEEIGYMSLLSCLKVMEEVALPIFKVTSDVGKEILSIVNKLEKVIPKEILQKSSGKDLGGVVGEFLSGVGGGMPPTGMPMPTSMPMPPSGGQEIPAGIPK